MADVRISDLPAASSSLDTHEFEVNESGTSKKVTTAQVITNVMADVAAGYQPLDSDLTALAGLAATAGMLARTGAGAFAVRTITAGDGIAVTNGTGASANPTIAVDEATAANVSAGAANKVITADAAHSAVAPISPSGSSNWAPDWTAFETANWTVDGNRTLSNPTNVVAGQTKIVTILGNNGTDRTISFGSNYKNVPTITDCDNAKAYTLTLFARTTTSILVTSVGYAI